MSSRVSTPTILNVTLTDADTEYPVTLPYGTTRVRVQARTAVDLKLSYQPGKSGALFQTIKASPAPPYKEDGLTNVEKLYLQCATAATVAEVVCWN